MHIARRFTTAGRDPYESVAFRSATSEIRNPDGSVVFAAEGIEVPAEWSQVACDILAQKYLRKAGVPARVAAIEEEGVPPWLWRRAADEAALAVLPKGERTIGETSAKQCFDRLAGTWTYWAWKGSYFDTEEDARAFFDELRLMLARLEYGRPLFLPPNVPAARIAALRRAFDATMKDPAYLAEADKLKIDVEPLSGEQVAALVEQVSRTPADTVARVRAALENR